MNALNDAGNWFKRQYDAEYVWLPEAELGQK